MQLDAGFKRREIKPFAHGRTMLLEQTMVFALNDQTPNA